MTHVITQSCCNDAVCVEVCPVDCIHPRPDADGFTKTEMLYIDAESCVDCGACLDVCPVGAIVPDYGISDADARYRDIAADHFRAALAPSFRERAPFSRTTKARSPAGQREGPLRVAIVGSGPAGCYAALDLASNGDVDAEVTIYERLPAFGGLVRYGVAPDHLKTKQVADGFRRQLRKRGVELRLNVEIGRHLSHDELLSHHHAIIYAFGASDDRRMGIAGEDVTGSFAASDFVAWYNGHPDHSHRRYDLSGERAVIVGNGNVALDIARVLVSDAERLAGSDIADYAREALVLSRIREVVVLGRRGPAQTAATFPELMGLGELNGVDILVDGPFEGADKDHLGAGDPGDFSTRTKTSILRQYAANTSGPDRKRIVFKYLRSPIEIVGADNVEGLRISLNGRRPAIDDPPSAEAFADEETIACSLVIRSIGYRGSPLDDLPFDERRGVMPNDRGRVTDATGAALPGVYVAGWMKRGPSGGIGANKHCSAETVAALVEDYVQGGLTPPPMDSAALESLVSERQPAWIDWQGWSRISAREEAPSSPGAQGRRKLTTSKALLDAARGDSG